MFVWECKTHREIQVELAILIYDSMTSNTDEKITLLLTLFFYDLIKFHLE